jgi:hypothetical protein
MTQATQSRHPWRATVRTVVAIAVAFLPLLPEIADQLGVATVPIVASVLTIAGGVTRVLANPRVNEILRQRKATAWLAAEPKPVLGQGPLGRRLPPQS